MAKVDIVKFKTTPAERKDIENVLAEDEKQAAILEYIAACDHPEIFEEAGEEGTDEYSVL